MSLELLREKFGYSGFTKEADNREKIHEKLNAQFNTNVDFKSIKVQHQEQLEEKQRIIENLKEETSELTNEVVTLKKEKDVLLKDLNNSKWMEDKVHSTSKKIYEDKIKTMSYVDSTELIPLLISVSREKQGNTRLNWGNWLKISENRYLFQINESIAKKVFEGTNVLIDRAVGFINRKRTRGGDEFVNNYSLTFDRTNEEYVTTEFDPIDYNLNQGFTVSFWVRPDELGGHRFAIGRRMAAAKGRFTFGLRNNTNLFVGVGNTKKTGFAHGMTDDGTWYHLVITYAGNSASPKTLKAYRDGEEIMDTTTSWPDADDENGIPIYFGARNAIAVDGYNLGWSCGLDEVAIFDEVKDSDWIISAYNAGKPNDLQNESGLVGYWRFNEGEGTNVEDLSGNGNNGTLTSDDEDTYGLPTWSSDVPYSLSRFEYIQEIKDKVKRREKNRGK